MFTLWALWIPLQGQLIHAEPQPRDESSPRAKKHCKAQPLVFLKTYSIARLAFVLKHFVKKTLMTKQAGVLLLIHKLLGMGLICSRQYPDRATILVKVLGMSRYCPRRRRKATYDIFSQLKLKGKKATGNLISAFISEFLYQLPMTEHSSPFNKYRLMSSLTQSWWWIEYGSLLQYTANWDGR